MSWKLLDLQQSDSSSGQIPVPRLTPYNKQLDISTDICEEVFIWIFKSVVLKVEESVTEKHGFLWYWDQSEGKKKKGGVRNHFFAEAETLSKKSFNLREF